MKQKKNCMKLLPFGILCSLFLNSCSPEVEKISWHLYSYTNNSGHNLSIEKWNEGNTVVYALKTSQTKEFKYGFNGGGCFIDGVSTTGNADDCLLISSDSIKIIFDDNKSILLKPKDVRDINILNNKNYTYSQDVNKSYYTYTFTEKEYLEAK